MQLNTKALYTKLNLQNQIEQIAKQTKNVDSQINSTIKGLLKADVIGKDDALILKDICSKASLKEEDNSLVK